MSELQAAICAAAVDSCIDAFGDRLHGIVLTGSLARREATFVRDSAGWNALGDAEFFVVFGQRCALPEAARIESVRQEAERTLMSAGIRCHIDLSPVHPSYLRRLQPHILAYELRECGQVVWGDPEVLALIPQFTVSDIVLEDAWRLLSNRMVEYLAIAEDLLQPDRPLPSDVFYRTVKLYLDMATSFLIFAGMYEPTYAARAVRLRSLVSRGPCGVTPSFPLAEFADRVHLCTAFKLQEPGHRDVDPSGFAAEAAIDFWKDAIKYARSLWRWELCKLTASPEGLSDNELIRRWMRRQTLMSRLRGWVRVLRDSDWRHSWRSWPRWALLALRGSPRHWVYFAAAQILFRLPTLADARDSEKIGGFDARSLSRRLPLVAQNESGAPWMDLATTVVANYQRFVAVTRT